MSNKSLQTTVEEVHNTITDFKQNIESRIRNLEVTKNRPVLKEEKQEEMSENKSAFLDYVRSGNEHNLANLETKALSVTGGDGEDGGYLIPHEMTYRVSNELGSLSIMRQIASTMTISTDAVDVLVDRRDAAAGWVAENAPRDETEGPQLGKIKIPVHELYAKPRATQRLLDDAQIDVETWLSSKIAAQMAKLENAAFVNGDGDNKPTGFMNYETVTKDAWDWGRFEHLLTGKAGQFSQNDPADILISATSALKPQYHGQAVWLMSRSSYEAVRKLKDGNGNYIWQSSSMVDTPSTLLGYPVHICDEMPDLVAGNASKAIVFGDFTKAYQIVDRSGVQIMRDQYSAKPHVEFYTTKRVGADVVDFEALKFINFAGARGQAAPAHEDAGDEAGD